MLTNNSRDKAIVVAAALIEKDGKLLMVQEGREEVRGKWNVPAGHFELGEDPITAVKREVKEETGFDVEAVSLAGIEVYKDKSEHTALRFNFNCQVVGGSFEEQEGEIMDIRWMSKKELEELRESGKLRSSKTWWSIETWLQKKSHPLEVIQKYEL